ncbi:MAG: hypothetical protein ACUVSQ_05820 [Pseudanabaenaceae cyanobacterium]
MKTIQTIGGRVTGRWQVEGAPISLRSSVLFGRDGTAIVPMVSWDVPAGDRLNFFVGAGGTFGVALHSGIGFQF